MPLVKSPPEKIPALIRHLKQIMPGALDGEFSDFVELEGEILEIATAIAEERRGRFCTLCKVPHGAGDCTECRQNRHATIREEKQQTRRENFLSSHLGPFGGILLPAVGGSNRLVFARKH